MNMPEIRKDYITNKWIVVATERAKRPDELRNKGEASSKPNICPFCPGNEHMTPPEVLAYRHANTAPNTQGWWVRCVPNKFPALRIEGDVDHRVNQLHNKMNGVGAHEVVIETPKHDECMAHMAEWQLMEVIHALRDRYNDLIKDSRFKYLLIFKNHGAEAGASMSHPHCQIIATPMIPKRIMEEINGAKRYYESSGGMCIYDDIIESELDLKERIIMDSSEFIALAPYAASFPFETWILPKKHDPSFEDISDKERADLAKVLKTVLKGIYDLLDNPPFNFILHTSPCDRNDYRFYHWHIEIIPRLTRVAGFEWGTGFYINPTPPEKAAEYMRNIIANPKQSQKVEGH